MLAGVLPLARLEAPLDVDQLALPQELSAELGETVPGLPLVVAAAATRIEQF